MFPDDTGCNWVISGNFKNFMIFMKLQSIPRRRVLRTPSPYTIGSAPSCMPRPGETIYIRFGRFFFNISGYLYLFGFALFVVQENISLLQWIAAGSHRKSIRERLGEVKVSCMMRNCDFSWFGDI